MSVPRYFVHHPPTASVGAIYWRSLSNFAGLPIHINLNLLAHAVGDSPEESADVVGGDLVAPLDYVTEDAGSDVVAQLQPFAYTRPGGDVDRPRALAFGPGLREFLDDPVGDRMELSLPFYDEGVELGENGGGWFKDRDDETSFHGGTDFMGTFDVCAAQAGRVEAARGQGVVLTHHTANGTKFRTVYQHMDHETVRVREDEEVRRGQLIGRPRTNLSDPHLHFGVAVQPRPFTGNRQSHLPARIYSDWYFIDPWGVYDYRSASTYLPVDNTYRSAIASATHTIQWRTEPLFKTIPIARSTEEYRRVVRIQVRVRRADNLGGTLPEEIEQFAVWLDGDAEFFLVPYAQATDRTAESNLESLLREAFLHSKDVRLEYRYVGDLRYVTAAWANA